MKRKRNVFLLSCLVVLLSLIVMSCTGSGSGSPKTYTLSGTLQNTDVPDGKFGYTKLVVHGGAGNATALYWAKSSAFLGGEATYSVTGIEQGTYTGYAFIDEDGDAAQDGSAMPNHSDWSVAAGQDFTIDSDQAFDIVSWIGGPPS